jgi:hypothetical protein
MVMGMAAGTAMVTVEETATVATKAVTVAAKETAAKAAMAVPAVAELVPAVVQPEGVQAPAATAIAGAKETRMMVASAAELALATAGALEASVAER